MKTFLNTLQGKVITGLTIISLVMGIGMAGVSIRRNIAETQAAIEVAKNAEIQRRADARIAEERAKTELETAKWAAMAKEAEAKKLKAEACSSRMKSMFENTPLDQQNYTVIERDCNPAVAEAAACEKEYNELANTIDQIHGIVGLVKLNGTLTDRIKEFGKHCDVSVSKRDILIRKLNDAISNVSP